MGAKARASISGAGPGQTKGSCRNHNVSGGAVFSPSHATRAATRLPGQPTGPWRPRLRQQACLVALVRAVADVRANDAWALVGARGCPARPPRWRGRLFRREAADGLAPASYSGGAAFCMRAQIGFPINFFQPSRRWIGNQGLGALSRQ